MNKPTTREERIALLASLNTGITKFAAKLTFEQRCEILALHRMGVRRDVLAKIYGVDRRTITHIHNPMSPHYKNVRAQETGMGREAFHDFYVTEELFNAVQARSQPEGKSNQYANKKAGLHMVQGPMCNYTHRVKIAWIEAGKIDGYEAGWYYCDLDGDFPDKWFTAGGPDSLKNSQACYAAMLTDITDKLT